MSRPAISTDCAPLARACTLVDTCGASSLASPAPPDWQVVPIGQLAAVTRGASPRPIDNPAWFDAESSTGWLRIADVTAAGKYLLKTRQGLSAAGMAHSRFVRSGNLVMSICATVGRPIITAKDVCIHDGFVVFENLKADIEYFYYLLSGMETTWSERGQTGSQMNLNTDIIKAAAIPLPPPSQQRVIAEALSAIDDLLRGLEVLVRKKRAVKRAAMQQLLTSKTRLPGFSGDWENKPLGEVFSIQVGTSKSRHITPGGSYLVVDMGSVDVDGRLNSAKRTDYGYDFLAKGDLVMPKDDIGNGGIIGKVARIDADYVYVLGDHVYALRLEERGCPVFFSYLINRHATNSSLRRKVGGSAQLCLSRKAVEEQELPIPSLREQRAIAAVLSDMDTEIATLERRFDKTHAIKQGMMQQLLAGRIRLVAPDQREATAAP